MLLLELDEITYHLEPKSSKHFPKFLQTALHSITGSIEGNTALCFLCQKLHLLYPKIMGEGNTPFNFYPSPARTKILDTPQMPELNMIFNLDIKYNTDNVHTIYVYLMCSI